MLSRKACSFFHSQVERERKPRYCKHILSELEEFYPDEFEILCMGASGEEVDFGAFMRQQSSVRHLREYGIVHVEKEKRPRFVIECLKTYLMYETARRENRPYSRRIFEGEKRVSWLSNRLTSLVKEFRALNAIVQTALSFQLFAGDTLFSPEEFIKMPVVINYDTLLSFLVTANRLINDSIDRSGKKQKLENFFFDRVQKELPVLFEALWRLRCYRHFVAHEALNPPTRAGLNKYLLADFGTKDKASFDDKECMIIQQVVLDEFALSIQGSIARFTN